MTAISSPANAVYSEPIKTNLDRLPPSSYRNNRKVTLKNTQNDKAKGSMRGSGRGGRGRARGRLSHADGLTKANTQTGTVKGTVSDASELETFEAVKMNGIKESVDSPEKPSESAPSKARTTVLAVPARNLRSLIETSTPADQIADRGIELSHGPEEDSEGKIENNSTTANPIGNGARKRKARNSTVSLRENASSSTSNDPSVQNGPRKRGE